MLASNDTALVDEIVEALGFAPDAPVKANGADKPVAEALRDDLELTMLTPGFLKAYAEFSGAEELADLTREGNEAALHAFMKEHQVADVVARWPASGLAPADFTAMLRKLQPRLYSIASSHAALPDEVHLTVGVTRTTPTGRPRSGVASTFLSDRRAPGDSIRVYVSENESFRLPEDPDTPLIMIGPGTGVAPFRAFMQEREETGAKGKELAVLRRPALPRGFPLPDRVAAVAEGRRAHAHGCRVLPRSGREGLCAGPAAREGGGCV